MLVMLAGTDNRWPVTEYFGKSVPAKRLVLTYRDSVGKRPPGGSLCDGQSARVAIPCVPRAIRRGRTRRGQSSCARVRANCPIHPDKTIQSEPTRTSKGIRSRTHLIEILDAPESRQVMSSEPRTGSVT